jgi:hypothetical protein
VTIGPLRVACIGMGCWSNVLADAIKRSDKIEIVARHTRSDDKRAAFAMKHATRSLAVVRAIGLRAPPCRGRRGD